LVIGFIEHLQNVTTSNYSATVISHKLQFTTARTNFSQFATVSTSRCLLVTSNGGRSTYSGFPNYPRPQLPATNSNSSQYLNCSSLTNLQTNPSLPCTALTPSLGTVSHQPPALQIDSNSANQNLDLSCL
jgi:hypothetical protein